MADRVMSVKARAVIKFNDVAQSQLELKVSSDMTLSNYIRSISVNEELNAINQNPVGVVSSNNVKFDIRSLSKDLIPENVNSPYYGYMNNSAIIYLYLEDEIGEFLFGVWYVDKWYSTVTSEDPYKVTIEAYDILSYIFNSSVPNVNISDSTSIKEYLIDILNELNSLNDMKHQILFDEADIVFNEFSTMQFSNLNTSNMSNLLNTIGQSTITNIYIDIRDNKLKTDYCGDDTAKDSVGNIGDTVNVTKASVDSSGLVVYSGVKVFYSLGIVNDVTQLTELKDQTLVIGDNQFYNIALGDSSIYRISYVKINTTGNVLAYNKTTKYNKNTLDLVVNSSAATKCNILVFGQTINESKLYKEKFRNNTGGSVLELTNRLLPASDIDKFVNEMIRLMNIKDGSVSFIGWINPRIGISKTVNTNLSNSINVNGYYKTSKLTWSITSSIKCNGQLLKTITA